MQVSNSDVFAYRINDSLYLNITNRCTSACTFCIRNNARGMEGHVLWLSHEPSADEVIQAVRAHEKEAGGTHFEEYVFCGYGEPLMRLDVVKEVASELKLEKRTVRLNTNGHGNLIHGRSVAAELAGLVDVASVSLNADSPGKYDEMCRPIYGLDALGAVVFFAEQCKLYIPRVVLTVVDVAGVNVDECRKIAETIGVEFRVRPHIRDDDET